MSVQRHKRPIRNRPSRGSQITGIEVVVGLATSVMANYGGNLTKGSLGRTSQVHVGSPPIVRHVGSSGGPS